MAKSSNKINLDKLITLIEKNGGADNLDLSGKDLSGGDFSRSAIIIRVNRRRYKERPIWQNHISGGLNLKRVSLQNANLFGADLSFVDLSGANLQESFLQAANLSNARLRNTNFFHVELNQCDLSGATAPGAIFDKSDMGSSNLTGTNFDEASLKDVSLYHAQLTGTQISRKELGNTIVQEYRGSLESFLLEHHASLGKEGVTEWLDRRQFEDARQVYASLKANFLGIGNYDDASWAHIKERQMAKMTHHPKHARTYYQKEIPQNAKRFSVHWWKLYFSHTIKWLLDWLAELTVGYGERPMRTIAWAILILFVFPFIFMTSGGIESTQGSMSWLDYFNYSFGAFSTMGFNQFEATTPLSQALTSLEALSGISILALLMFALGNRMSRS